VFGQDTPLSETPDGKLPVGVDQLVRLPVEKEPAKPEFEIPTATQFVVLAHDIDLRAIAGSVLRNVQSVPSCVPTADGVPLRTPTATQSFDEVHEMLAREARPVGDTCGDQDVPSVVFRMVELPPTAVQTVADTQEMPSVRKAESSTFQVVPPSSLFRIPGLPPTKQTEFVGQETAERPTTLGGMSAFVQVAPPSSEVTIDGTLLPLSPTATQVVGPEPELGAQETARTLTSGANEAVVCHCGVVAPAGVRPAGVPKTPKASNAMTAQSAEIAEIRPTRIRSFRR
jgi:hypothetical protein